VLNPYQTVISVLGRTLAVFDDDNLIPAFGFGDSATGDKRVFPLQSTPCQGFQQVLDSYSQIVPRIKLSGPTSFAPLIYETIKIVRQTKSYHILIIIADGQVTNEKENIDAIVAGLPLEFKELKNHKVGITVALHCVLNGPVGVNKNTTFPVVGAGTIKTLVSNKVSNKSWKGFCYSIAKWMVDRGMNIPCSAMNKLKTYWPLKEWTPATVV